jgi:hypothetical protein
MTLFLIVLYKGDLGIPADILYPTQVTEGVAGGASATPVTTAWGRR